MRFLHSGQWLQLLIALTCSGLMMVGISGISYASSEQKTAGQASFTLQPVYYDPSNPATRSYFVINTRQGVTVHNEVRVINDGTEKGTVSLSPADGTTAQTTGIIYSPTNPSQHEVGSWIMLGTNQLTLAPGQSQIVPFQIIIPEGEQPGQHIGGIIAASTGQQLATNNSSSSQLHINVEHQMIIAVLLNVAGTQVEQLATTGLQVSNTNGYQSLLLGLHNTGDTMLKPSGNLQVANSQGQVVQKLSLTMQIILPQATIDYPVYVQQQPLQSGTYQATLTLMYGQHHTLKYTTTFTVTQQQVKKVVAPVQKLQTPTAASPFPYWLITLVALLICGLGLGGLLVYRTRGTQAGRRR